MGRLQPRPNNVPFVDDDRAHRHLTQRIGTLCFAQRFLHQQLVGMRHEGEG